MKNLIAYLPYYNCCFNMPERSPYRKTCVVCGRVVYPGTGTYHRGVLVHRTCKGLLEANWRRYIDY
jgi:hypothetical protein